MPTRFPLTETPLNLSATLDGGCYIVQYTGPFLGFYGAFPTSGADPTDTDAMFTVANGDYFSLNVGGSYAPVWVAGIDFGPGVGAGQLVIEESTG